jgi:predicted SAM-dependent methyltransferase
MKRFIDTIFWKISEYQKWRIARVFHTYATKKIQLGSGLHILKGWLNTDIKYHYGTVYLDARRVFPFSDSCIDAIYAEHFLEHLSEQESRYCLTECYRVMKKGGVIRITTPDIRFVIDMYLHPEKAENRKYRDWFIRTLFPEKKIVDSVFMINSFFHMWGHTYLYDEKTLEALLRQSGFHAMKFYKTGESEHIHFKNIESRTSQEFQSETMIVEAIK